MGHNHKDKPNKILTSFLHDEDVKNSLLVLVTIIFGSFFFFWNSIVLKKIGIQDNFVALTAVLIVFAILYFIALKKLAR